MQTKILYVAGAVWCLILALANETASAAPNITGTWQGTWHIVPRVLKIEKSSDDTYRTQLFSLDEWKGGEHGQLNGNSISVVRVKGNDVTFSVDRSGESFEGTLSKEKGTLSGTWHPGWEPTGPMAWQRVSKNSAWMIDPSPHKVRMIPVEKDVSVEVLDWGGNGPPLLLLAGLGDTAHDYDKFALSFTAKHHVYGMTRRGYGISSVPPPTDDNYDPDRLGDDVLAVMDALKLGRPILAGHSLAGEELSSIGSRHPEEVAGLIYLDGAFDYAFYEPKVIQYSGVDYSTIRRDISRLDTGVGPAATQTLTNEIQSTLPRLQDELRYHLERSKGQPEHPPQATTPQGFVGNAIILNTKKYTAVKSPFLALIASPHVCQPNCNSAFAKNDAAVTKAQADAIHINYPSAKIVRLPFALHDLWRSNEADVVREMNAFMDSEAKR